METEREGPVFTSVQQVWGVEPALKCRPGQGRGLQDLNGHQGSEEEEGGSSFPVWSLAYVSHAYTGFILERCQSGSVIYLTQTLNFSSGLRAAANCEQRGPSDAESDAAIVRNSYLLLSYVIISRRWYQFVTFWPNFEKRKKKSRKQQNIFHYIVFVYFYGGNGFIWSTRIKSLCSYLFLFWQQIQLHYMG